MNRLCIAVVTFFHVAHAQEPGLWFAPVEQLDIGADIDHLFAADLDQDGDTDLVLGGIFLHVAWNTGDGLGWEVEVIEPRRPLIGPFAVIDDDLDGDLDIVTFPDDYVTVYRQGPPGIWTEAPEDVVEFDLSRSDVPEVFDVDQDGAPDILVNSHDRAVVLAREGGSVRVPLADGLSYGTRPADLCDLDGDGDLDMITLNHRGDVFRLFDVAGWPLAAAAEDGWGRLQAGRLGDIDGDQDCEFVYSDASEVRVATRPADALDSLALAGVAPYRTFSFVDLDGDGDRDLLGAALNWEQSVQLVENGGAAGFRTHRRDFGDPAFRANANRREDRFLPADTNGDGLLDAYTLRDRRVWRAQLVRGHFAVVPTYAAGADAEGGQTLVTATLAVSPILAEVPRITRVRLALRDADGLLDPDAQVVAAVELYREADGVEGWTEGDPRVGAGVGAVSEVALDEPADATLHLVVRLAAGAHLFAESLNIEVTSASGAFAGGAPATAGQPDVTSATWTLVNRAPTAVADDVQVAEGDAVVFDVLANDSDPTGDPLTVEVVEPPAHGQIEALPGGALRYTHDGSDELQIDTFQYRVVDPGGQASAPAPVEIIIDPRNDPPEGRADTYQTSEDTPLDVPWDLGVLVNDVDPDGPERRAELVEDVVNGVLELAPDGSFTYTPRARFSGADGFTYRLHDGLVAAAPVRVNLTVQPINDAPIGADDALMTLEDTPLDIQLRGDDEDEDALWFLIESLPEAGHLRDLDRAQGTLAFVPAPEFTGVVQLQYRVTDGLALSPLYTVSIEVLATVDDDDDGDGTADAQDVCPAVADDQSDLDGDGLGDACDDDADGDGAAADVDCDDLDPAVQAPQTWYFDADGDGVGQIDFELVECAGAPPADYAAEPGDNCPLAANPDQADRDDDGRGDACDACPDDAADAEDGCPPIAAPNAARPAGTTPDATASASGGAFPDPPPEAAPTRREPDAGGCAVGGGPPHLSALLVLALCRRRRRRSA